MEVYVGIPCFNVASEIIGVLTRLLRTNNTVNVLILNDGSTDELLKILKHFDSTKFRSFQIHSHKENKGYGEAQKSLFEIFLNLSINDTDLFLLVHGDGQTNESEIPRFLEAFSSNNQGVVLGSRMLSPFIEQFKKGRFFYKILFDYINTVVLNIIFSNTYSTYASGYRAFKRTVIADIDFSNTSSSHIFDTELLLILGNKNIVIKEIPIEVVHSENQSSDLRVWFKYGKDTFHVIFKYL